MKKIQLTIVLLVCSTLMIFAQSGSSFTPHGKPFAKIYTNFNYTSVGGEGTPSFQIKRAYLGYKYDFSENFSAKLNIDVDNPGVGKLQMTAFLKNAYLQYKKNKLSVSFGMIATSSFKVSEAFWGKRWIYKSFQDESKFESSADIGVFTSYKISSFLSVDASIINGEGYKLIQSDKSVKTTFGATLTPFKSLIARVYVDQMKDEVSAQQTLSTFIGYENKFFKVAGEYDIQKNHLMVEGQDFSGMSFYTSIPLFKSFKLFGRYDHLNSVKPEANDMPWNLSKDGELFMAGIEFSPVKGVNIAPCFHGWKPADDSKDFINGFYLNFEYKF